MLSQISESKFTRNSSLTAKFSYVTNPQTRSASDETMPDTLLYIINFGDSEGFAVVSTDDRTRPIYAISDEGYLDFSDTTSNKGLKEFFDEAIIDYRYGISIGPIDTVKPNPDALNPYVYCTDIIYPMIPKTVRKWDQKAPFNASIRPNQNTDNPLVGCGAVGVGMIMTYFKYPQKYYAIPMDWEAITGDDYTNKAIADFLYELGKPHNLSMSYEYWGSHCDLERIPITFNNYDYVNPVNYKLFDTEKVFAALEVSPILMAARMRNDLQMGHIWVIDGRVNYSENIMQDSTKLFHCVWGWGGIANGYFFFNGGFDANSPIMHDFEDMDSGTKDANFNLNPYFWGPFQTKF